MGACQPAAALRDEIREFSAGRPDGVGGHERVRHERGRRLGRRVGVEERGELRRGRRVLGLDLPFAKNRDT